MLNAMHPILRSVAGPCASVLFAYDHASIVLLALVAVAWQGLPTRWHEAAPYFKIQGRPLLAR